MQYCYRFPDTLTRKSMKRLEKAKKRNQRSLEEKRKKRRKQECWQRQMEQTLPFVCSAL